MLEFHFSSIISMNSSWGKRCLVLMLADTMTVWAEEPTSVHLNFWTPSLYWYKCTGLPPIINFGKPALRDKIVEEVFAGKKLCALAITEAFAGSDVAGLKCHAKKVEGGYRVTGTYVISQAVRCIWSWPFCSKVSCIDLTPAIDYLTVA